MSEPRGWNPVGQSAPGLPRHDAPLPGHVPGQPAQQLGGGAGATATPFGLPSGGYFPGAIWLGRLFILGLVYLMLPLLIALYPIAGVPALFAGWVAHGMLHAAGMGYDDVMSWSWTIALIVFLPMMRVEIRTEDRVARYRALRHWARLVLVAGGTFYVTAVDQQAPFGIALLSAAFVAVLLHFLLHSGFLTLFSYTFQTSLWLRKK